MSLVENTGGPSSSCGYLVISKRALQTRKYPLPVAACHTAFAHHLHLAHFHLTMHVHFCLIFRMHVDKYAEEPEKLCATQGKGKARSEGSSDEKIEKIFDKE